MTVRLKGENYLKIKRATVDNYLQLGELLDHIVDRLTSEQITAYAKELEPFKNGIDLTPAK